MDSIRDNQREITHMRAYDPITHKRTPQKERAVFERLMGTFFVFASIALILFPEIRPPSLSVSVAYVLLGIFASANLILHTIVECANAPQ